MNLSIQNKTKKLTLLSMTVIILLLAGCSSNEPKNPPQVNPIPKIHIYTDNGLDPDCKENYLSATFSFDGKETPWENIVEKPMRIRGRGNSTWYGPPKKPWRVNFSSANATSLFGLPPARDWVFLANYYDPTHLLNATASELGHRLDIPLTFSSHFVELYLNGSYRGLYQVTEHLRQNTIPHLSADDILMELDNYFDEEFQFKSNLLGLPVMIQEPRSQAGLDKAKIIWDNIENTLFGPVYENAPEVLDSSNWRELFDVQSIMKYLLLYELMGNTELYNPNSFWMIYKGSSGKIHFGPIWDFDEAWSFFNSVPFAMSDILYHSWLPLADRTGASTRFINRFFDDPTFVRDYKEYCKSIIGKLNTDRFVDSLGATLKPYAEKDFQIWDRIYHYDTQIKWFKNFYNKRLSAMKDYGNLP